MKNKKIIITLIALIILSVTLPTFAATITTESSQEVTVTYQVGEGYTVSIPADISFSSTDQTNYTATGNVSATGVLIETDNTLNVKMTSANYENGAYTLQDSSGESKIVYTIKNGDQDFENDTNVLSVSAGADNLSAETTLNFATTSDEIAKATKSGAHTDTLTFTVSIDNN